MSASSSKGKGKATVSEEQEHVHGPNCSHSHSHGHEEDEEYDHFEGSEEIQDPVVKAADIENAMEVRQHFMDGEVQRVQCCVSDMGESGERSEPLLLPTFQPFHPLLPLPAFHVQRLYIARYEGWAWRLWLRRL